jgi:hypothetical protein
VPNSYSQDHGIGFQATCASATSGLGPSILPHHPIQCTGGSLSFGEDGSFWCAHAKVSQGDPRTQAALIHSLACLIIEEAAKL